MKETVDVVVTWENCLLNTLFMTVC